MSSENRESQQYTTNETLGDMVSKKFNISRKKFKANNYQWLAKMAKIPGKEEPYVGSLEQNIRIRKRILNNDILPLQEFSAVIKKFSPDQQKAIAESFPDKKINSYLSNISPTQLEKFITLSPTQLVAFLDQETKKVQEKKEKIKQQTAGSEINDATTEQVVSLNQLIHVEEKIANFISKHHIKELERDKTTGIFVEKITEQKFQTFSTQLTPEQKTQYEQLKINKGEKVADTFVRTLYQTQMLQTPEIQSTLSDEAKNEFVGIVEEFYVTSKNLDVDMSSFGLQTLYEKAKAYLIEKYTTSDTYQKLSYNINSAPAVSTYFAENAPAELVPEAGKDKAYYTKVVRWYPALDTSYEGKKLSEYLPYFNDDMTIKSEVPDQQKKLMLSLLPQLKEKSKPYEKKLLGMTNSLTQTVAVEQCITTLQSYMDVNISEQENVMQQLNIAENRDAVSENLVVKINGTLNGKKIVMSYDLLTGNVFYQSFLTKQSDTEQSPITIGGEQTEETVPLITLPKFGDFIDASKTIDYTTTIHTCETQDQYSKKITETLENTAKAKQDMTSQKDMLKKYILKDIITQNIFSLTGRTTDGLQNSVLITPSSQPQMHVFYNFLSNSLTYYSMGSIDDLQLFQKNIQTLLTYATGPTKTQSTESALAYKDKNQEMFVMQSLLNQANIPSVTSSLRDQQPEEKLLSFFRCFEKKIGAISVIDAEMMDDFFTASRGTNKEANAVGKRKRSPAFAKLSNDMEKNMESTDADDMLQDMPV